jgi:benzoyl-CoA-dihydrodiol lyase
LAEAISFDTDPTRWRHWSLDVAGDLAILTMRVDPAGGLHPDYELKLNSYDFAVDVELRDAVQRLRFEHPEVAAVVLTGGLDRVFCAGANIQMLAGATHEHKVNFCKFTNETRLAIEEATEHSGQTWIAAVNGIAAGGGYELALACDEIVLVDDGSSAVSMPEVPLLAVLPGTGGLTRLVDKRRVRRDLADAFCTRAEGVKGRQALEWGLVDELAPPSRLLDAALDRARARTRARARHRAGPAAEARAGIRLHPVTPDAGPDSLAYRHVEVRLDRALGAAFVDVHAPTTRQPADPEELTGEGDAGWLIAVSRDLDDALLRLRFGEPDVGTWVLRAVGDPEAVIEAEAPLEEHADHWLVREIRLLLARTLKRLDLSSRSLFALVEPGTCFAGVLAELALAADRTYMIDTQEGPAPTFRLTAANTGWFPMANGLSRLATRFWGRPDALASAEATLGKELLAPEAAAAGLVTFTPDELDWDDEIRLALEERHGFSPDALTGMEASLRFVGPETMETKIFGRLSAWQNWVFQRPNATGPDGALRRFGTGSRPAFGRARA